MSTLRGERRGLVTALVTLGVPIALQSLIGSSLNLLDSLMIGSLGTARIAGVALANQVFFLLNLFLFGVGSGAGVFVAQYWGGRDVAGIRRSLGVCLALTLAGAALLFVLGQAVPGAILSLFSADPEVISEGTAFLRIVSVGFLFQAVSASYMFVLRSTERTKVPLAASAISLGVNTLLNWILIYGHLGMPALGVRGSAIATLTARFLEMSIVLGATYRRRGAHAGRQPAAARIGELLAFDLPFLRRYLRVILPVVANEVGWALGLMAEMAVFGRMGTGTIASYSIADTAVKLAIVVFFSIVNASAIIVGKRIGAGDRPGAMRAASFYSLLAPVSGVILGAILVGASFFMPAFFNVGRDVQAGARIAMIIYACVLPLRLFNWQVIVGVLRAGGDTLFSLAMDLGGTWLVGLPLMAAAGLLFGAPFWLVFLLALTEDLPKGVLGALRMRSGRWLNDLTVRARPALR